MPWICWTCCTIDYIVPRMKDSCLVCVSCVCVCVCVCVQLESSFLSEDTPERETKLTEILTKIRDSLNSCGFCTIKIGEPNELVPLWRCHLVAVVDREGCVGFSGAGIKFWRLFHWSGMPQVLLKLLSCVWSGFCTHWSRLVSPNHHSKQIYPKFSHHSGFLSPNDCIDWKVTHC